MRKNFIPHSRKYFDNRVRITRTDSISVLPAAFTPSYTISGASFGPEPGGSEKRTIVVLILVSGNIISVNMSSITIDGGADAKINGKGTYEKAWSAAKEVASGESGNIVITLSGSASPVNIFCEVFSLIKSNSAPVNDDSETVANISGNTATLDPINVSKGGILLINGWHESASGATITGDNIGDYSEIPFGNGIYGWAAFSREPYLENKSISNASVTASLSRNLIGTSFS